MRIFKTELGDFEVTAPPESEVDFSVSGGVVEIRVGTGPARVKWMVPCVDAVAYWTPDSNEHRGLPPFWRSPRTVSLAKGAPVGCLVGLDDVAVCAFAAFDGVNPVSIKAGVVEETNEFGVWVEQKGPMRLRVDLSRRHFAQVLGDIARWWGSDERQVPRSAREPVYSTWYTMQQHVDASKVERQAWLAGPLGCTAIIVDDGWHSTDRQRGYAYVGDWNPSEPAFPDMAKHVARVRERGMAYLLWYAVPFAGRRSTLWDRVKDHLLVYKERMNAGVVDPRYPYVRRLLVEKVARATGEWGMDGVKVDFIDQFAVEHPPATGPGADCATVTEGLHKLMGQLGAALPEGALVELRQPYVSPGLWPFATMIRASDCPLSPVHNRQRTVDLRLIAGPLAVHSDMMMWHRSESPESVAAQLISVLFAVPQISVDLAEQTPDVMETLGFWLGFFAEHQKVLQHGELRPARPDLNYPLVSASNEQLVIVGRYAPVPVSFDAKRNLLIANADPSPVVLFCDGGEAEAVVRDCRGREIGSRQLDPGTAVLEVPLGGLLTVTPA